MSIIVGYMIIGIVISGIYMGISYNSYTEKLSERLTLLLLWPLIFILGSLVIASDIVQFIVRKMIQMFRKGQPMTLLEQIRQIPDWELREFLVKLGCEGRECNPSCMGYEHCRRGHNGIRVMLDKEAPKTDDVEVAESRCKED